MKNSEIINKLKKLKDISSIRPYIWEKIATEIENRSINQEVLSEKFWSSHSYINQIIKWKTGSSSKYIELAQFIWISDANIIEFFREARTKENEDLFWEPLILNTLDNLKIEDLTLEDIREAMADNTLFSKGGKISDNEALDEVIKYAMEKWDMELMKRVIKKN